jgi:hypothetical protein
MIPLTGIAASAEDSEIREIIGATSRLRDDVIHSEVRCCVGRHSPSRAALTVLCFVPSYVCTS